MNGENEKINEGREKKGDEMEKGEEVDELRIREGMDWIGVCKRGNVGTVGRRTEELG